MKKDKFPKVIYVTNEDDDFLAWDRPSASECDGDTVAIYELKDIKTLKLTSVLA